MNKPAKRDKTAHDVFIYRMKSGDYFVTGKIHGFDQSAQFDHIPRLDEINRVLYARFLGER